MDGIIDRLVSKLNLEQKVRLLTGKDFWTLYPEPAVGLRSIALSDGPVGVRGVVDDERDTSANLPSATAIAASWDTGLVARLAVLLAAEARRKGIDVVLGPTVNLHRSPLGGRHFECYSEDPYLTSALGTAYVRAMQERGVGATPKHYVANDSETERFTVDVQLAERPLREMYLRPFEDMVTQTGAWLVMAAYNSVNGATMTENPLLAEPLKGEWGFDGVVVSDWFAARDTVPAGNAALDLVMPAANSPWGDDLVAAVRAGRVSEEAVDDKVRRILLLAARVGALSTVDPTAPAPTTVEPTAVTPTAVTPAPVAPQPVAPQPVAPQPVAAQPVAAQPVAPQPFAPQPLAPEPFAPGEIAALVREAAAAGTVLLANPSGVLPLDPGALRRVAVLGPSAAQARTQGGGSATVHPAYTISPLDGLRAALPDGVELNHVAGARIVTGLVAVDALVASDPVTGTAGVRQQALDADGGVLRDEHRRVGRLSVHASEGEGIAQLRASCRIRADEAGEWRFGFTGLGSYRLTIDGETVLDETLFPDDIELTSVFADPPQQSVGRTLAVGQEVELTLTYDVLAGAPMQLAALCYERPSRPAEQELQRAADAARVADVAVVVVGTTSTVESEGLDRAGLALPGNQNDLVHAVAAANPRTVVVVNSGSPVLMPWRDEVAAVLLAWFGGQEMGNALADVLFGVVEPGGRLPTTWPVREQDVPVLNTRPTDGRLEYSEGIFIGYRAWLRAGTEPAYPFGHGLGYTTWSYDTVDVAAVDVTPVDAPAADVAAVDVAAVDVAPGSVSVAVTNTGQRPGKEVVQVYLSTVDGTVDRPARWLVGFGVALAEPGETVTVRVPLDRRAFQYWSTVDHAWTDQPGTFTVHVGRSVLDTPLTASVKRP